MSIAQIRAVIKNKIIIYTVSVLIASMIASIIFLSAGTRRVFSVEIFLCRDVAPVSAMFIVPVHRPFVRHCYIVGVFVACCLVGVDWPMVLKMAVLSFIDGTNGFVHAMVICGRLPHFPVPTSCSALLLVLSSLLLVVWYLLWYIAGCVLWS